MSSTGDKINDLPNEDLANARQTIGRASGNDRLEAEGVAQEQKGEARQPKGKAKGTAKEAVKNIIDRT
jgi:uncharacterized protein YjbJ (UPF0337 family)